MQESQYEPVQSLETQIELSLPNDGLQNVTYSWENLSVYFNIPTGGCVSRLCCKKSPPIQKKILQNGTSPLIPIHWIDNNFMYNNFGLIKMIFIDSN